MKTLFRSLGVIIKAIAFFVFCAGIVLTLLGIYDFAHSFAHIDAEHMMVGLIGTGMIRAVDLFLIAIVLFVFALGVLLLFNTRPEAVPENLPEWLNVKDFIHLKIILWEAILTSLLVSFLAGLVEAKLKGEIFGLNSLVLPGAILIIAISLFFLKKGEGKH